MQAYINTTTADVKVLCDDGVTILTFPMVAEYSMLGTKVPSPVKVDKNGIRIAPDTGFTLPFVKFPDGSKVIVSMPVGNMIQQLEQETIEREYGKDIEWYRAATGGPEETVRDTEGKILLHKLLYRMH